MTAQLELALSIDPGKVPADLFTGGAGWIDSSKIADDAFPVESLPGGISLRRIERGVWLWGASWNYRTKTGGSGGGFGPFRKWGPEHAAMTREAAIAAARLYIAGRMR